MLIYKQLYIEDLLNLGSKVSDILKDFTSIDSVRIDARVQNLINLFD